MSTSALQQQSASDMAPLYESLALRGDISGLTPPDKARFYGDLCTRLGLDPYTQPFIPLKLNGKEILYASKGATDQLARINNVNRAVISRERIEDVYVVTVRATLPNGRTEEEIGAVALGALKGEALCNAMMKATTKAKRRATLALLGLGMLDESEMDTIPAHAMEQIPVVTATALPPAGVSAEPTAEEERGRRVREVRETCTKMNDAGAEPKWTAARLNSYINETFEVTDGIGSLGFESLAELQRDLLSQLEWLKAAASAESAHEQIVGETEVLA